MLKLDSEVAKNIFERVVEKMEQGEKAIFFNVYTDNYDLHGGRQAYGIECVDSNCLGHFACAIGVDSKPLMHTFVNVDDLI